MFVQPARVVRAAISVSVLMALAAAVQPSASLWAQGQTLTDVIIAFRTAPGAVDEAFVQGVGGRISHRYTIVPAIAASLPAPALAALAANPRVERIEPDGRVFAIGVVDFAAELANTWGVERIGAGTVHSQGETGGTGSVRVAVIDSGIDCNHPDLSGRCDASLGYDFVNEDDVPADDNGHGTHVAGTIAAIRDGAGVVGVAPDVLLVGLKVLDENGSGSFSDVIAAVDLAAANAIQVTNNSYGSGSNPGVTVEQAFANAAAAGVLHIAAAGNSGNCGGKGDRVGYPAHYSSVVAVAATTQSDARPCFSSTGPDVELAAPGVSINSTVPGGGYASFNGTSMASPHVAGVAALVFSVGASDTNGTGGAADEVRGILQATAEDLGAGGRDEHFGYGLVAAVAAVGTITSPQDAVNVHVDTDKDTYVIDADTQVVVTVTVTDEGGQPISGVSNAAIDVTIDGDPEDVTLDETAGGSGVYTGALSVDAVGAGPHVVAVYVTDGTITGDGSASFTVSSADAPSGDMSVTGIDYSTNGGRFSDRHLSVTITVVADGAPVGGASVSITLKLDEGVYGTASGTTDSNGQVTFSSSNAPSGTYTTEITAVSAPGLTWDGVTPPNSFDK
jgi:subtilisin